MEIVAFLFIAFFKWGHELFERFFCKPENGPDQPQSPGGECLFERRGRTAESEWPLPASMSARQPPTNGTSARHRKTWPVLELYYGQTPETEMEKDHHKRTLAEPPPVNALSRRKE